LLIFTRRSACDEHGIKLPEDFDRMGADYEKFREYLIAKHAA
jgi:hypothetical protein